MPCLRIFFQASEKVKCYLCNSLGFTTRKGVVRDDPNIQIVECNDCGLVFLSQTEQITSDFYQNSGMHSERLSSIEEWLQDTEVDDQRRFELVKNLLPNKNLLDFGCGAAGFLNKAKTFTESVTGIELEARIRQYWAEQINIVSSVEEAITTNKSYDLITAFHVLEHCLDPREVLKSLSHLLEPNGRMIVEVPNSEDALLTTYDCDAFQRFSYWSQHLFLFNSNTLEKLALQAGLRVTAIQHYQRYPLSNHLYWLSQGKPGGHQKWSFLNNSETTQAYADSLAAIGKTDTLIAYLELEPMK
jgi:2-polyprenyl-3-methyl-5-hydroxy-6-metoxy-1,4-benzoquinol methylase